MDARIFPVGANSDLTIGDAGVCAIEDSVDKNVRRIRIISALILS
jgi:hypothetical protein